MKRLVLVCLLAIGPAIAQDWTAIYSTGSLHYDDPRAILVDAQGNSYVAGYARGIRLIKYNTNGETLWTRVYQRPSLTDTNGVGLAFCSNGDLMLAAGIRKDTFNGFCLMRYQPDGSRLWDTVYWHSHSSSAINIHCELKLAVLPSGNMYVGGTSRDTARDDMVVCRFRANGGIAWARKFDGRRHYYDRTIDMAVDASENVYLAGYSYDALNKKNATVLKYDSAGSLTWSYMHRTETDYTSSLEAIALSGSSVYLVGSQQLLPGGATLGLLVKLNSGGDSAWSRTDSSDVRALTTDAAGNVFTTGRYDGRRITARTMRFSTSGTREWRHDLIDVDSAQKSGYAIVLAPDQTLSIAGIGSSTLSHNGLLAARYSTSGQLAWYAVSETVGTWNDVFIGAGTDAASNLYLLGRHEHLEAQQHDFITMRFRASGAVEEPSASLRMASALRVSPTVTRDECRVAVAGSIGVVGVMDAAGRMVRTLVARRGSGEFEWDGCGSDGRLVPGGVYFVVAQTKSGRSSAKVIVQH